jgi:hypothetical protein
VTLLEEQSYRKSCVLNRISGQQPNFKLGNITQGVSESVSQLPYLLLRFILFDVPGIGEPGIADLHFLSEGLFLCENIASI